MQTIDEVLHIFLDPHRCGRGLAALRRRPLSREAGGRKELAWKVTRGNEPGARRQARGAVASIEEPKEKLIAAYRTWAELPAIEAAAQPGTVRIRTTVLET